MTAITTAAHTERPTVSTTRRLNLTFGNTVFRNLWMYVVGLNNNGKRQQNHLPVTKISEHYDGDRQHQDEHRPTRTMELSDLYHGLFERSGRQER